jgi:superfamily II DNA or RNA helicase
MTSSRQSWPNLKSPVPIMASGRFPFDHQIKAFDAVLQVQDDRTKVHIVQGPTGSGKTLVESMLASHFCEKGFNILWLTNGWQLTRQLEKEFRTAFPRHSHKLRRIGGRNENLNHLSEDGRGQIFLSTLQTWNARAATNLPSRVRRSSNLVIIIDECHWGYLSKCGRKLRRYYLPKRHSPTNNPLVVGFSATPVDCAESTSQVVFSTPFASLVDVTLARPRIQSVKTGIAWDPILRQGIVTDESLQQSNDEGNPSNSDARARNENDRRTSGNKKLAHSQRSRNLR